MMPVDAMLWAPIPKGATEFESTERRRSRDSAVPESHAPRRSSADVVPSFDAIISLSDWYRLALTMEAASPGLSEVLQAGQRRLFSDGERSAVRPHDLASLGPLGFGCVVHGARLPAVGRSHFVWVC